MAKLKSQTGTTKTVKTSMSPTTTANAPVGTHGDLYYDTTLDALMVYDTSWTKVDTVNIGLASGGTKTYDGAYSVHTFTGDGNFVVTGGNLVCDCLVVGAGGGGAADIVAVRAIQQPHVVVAEHGKVLGGASCRSDHLQASHLERCSDSAIDMDERCALIRLAGGLKRKQLRLKGGGLAGAVDPGVKPDVPSAAVAQLCVAQRRHASSLNANATIGNAGVEHRCDATRP